MGLVCCRSLSLDLSRTNTIHPQPSFTIGSLHDSDRNGELRIWLKAA
jgi:hypothetical protein